MNQNEILLPEFIFAYKEKLSAIQIEMMRLAERLVLLNAQFEIEYQSVLHKNQVKKLADHTVWSNEPEC